jgi:hypothetical protein
MIVWGGSGASGPLGDGAAYDVADRSWTLLPVAPISARTHVQMVWTGSEVLVFGGDTATGTASNGALLNLATGTWRDVPIAPVDARSAPNAALTTGGFVFFGPGTDGSGAPFDGARLALGTLTWSTIPVPEPAALAPRGGMQSWSDGERLFLWSGASSIDPPMFVEGGAAFDVTSSTWQPLEGKDAPAGRTRAVALWTGKAGLIWGGFGTPGGGAMMPLADGAIYVP